MSDHQHERQKERRTDLRHAIVGGAIAAVVGFGGMALVGAVSSYQAERLVQATLPTIRFLASTLVAASVTIMALMLTMLSLSSTHNADFKPSHYHRLRQISTMSAILIVASLLLLLFVAIPIEESDTVQHRYYIVYYSMMAGAAAATGLLIAIVMMLNYAIRGIVGLFIPGANSDLIAEEEENEERQDRELAEARA